MLTLPASSGVDYRILGIDPGTDTLGVGLLAINLHTHRVRVCDADTLIGHTLLHHSESLVETLGLRQTRLMKLSEALNRRLTHCQPHAVVCEAPYLGRFPQAFGALVECLSMIRHCVYAYDPSLQLYTVDPASAKASVGVSGRSGDKHAVFDALNQLPNLDVEHTLNLSMLDEHSIDALLMGCYYAHTLGYPL